MYLRSSILVGVTRPLKRGDLSIDCCIVPLMALCRSILPYSLQIQVSHPLYTTDTPPLPLAVTSSPEWHIQRGPASPFSWSIPDCFLILCRCLQLRDSFRFT